MTNFVFITGSPQATVQFVYEAELAQTNGEIIVTDELQKEMNKVLVLSNSMPTPETLRALAEEKEVRELYHIEYETIPLRAIYRCEVEARNIGHALVLFWREHPHSSIRAMNHVRERHGSVRNPGIQKVERSDSGEEADISI